MAGGDTLMPRTKTVDPKSYELAEHFLKDVPPSRKEDTQHLAEEIQTTVEDFISDIWERHA